jgi:hypothetical protein
VVLTRWHELSLTGVSAELDRAAAIHEIAKRLNLSSGSSVDAEKIHSLHPDTTVAILCDLLKIRYGDDFDPMRMSDISCLECARTKDGVFIWVSRSEIDSKKWPDVSLCHDHVTGVYDSETTAQDESKLSPQVELPERGSSDSSESPSAPVASEESEASQTFHHSSSSTKTMSPEKHIGNLSAESSPIVCDNNTEASPAHTANPENDISDHPSPQTAPQASGSAGSTEPRPELAPSDEAGAASLATQASQYPVSPTVSVSLNRSKSSLCILGADNLPKVRYVGTQRPYCEWEIVTLQGVRVAFGRTERDDKSSSSPKWNQSFPVPLTSDQVARLDYKIRFVVKTPTLFVQYGLNRCWDANRWLNSQISLLLFYTA